MLEKQVLMPSVLIMRMASHVCLLVSSWNAIRTLTQDCGPLYLLGAVLDKFGLTFG